MFNSFKATLIAAGAAIALGTAGNAQALVVLSSGTVDTVTELVIDWTSNSSGGTLSYFGTHWNATVNVNELNSLWTIGTTYQHLDGPHGEIAEPSTHSHSISFYEPTGSASSTGFEDHLVLQHVGIHQWTLSGSATPISTAQATLSVLHPVPEPETWALMLLGLGGLAASRRKIRS